MTGMLSRLAPGASIAPDAILLESRGTVLVIGGDAAMTEFVSALAQSLKVVVFAPGIRALEGVPESVTAVGGRVVSLSGTFGTFRAQAAVPEGGSRDIGGFSANADGSFDLILDLSATPLLSGSVTPLGYFASHGDQAALAAAAAELSRLVGRFAKPRFVDYEESYCAHGAKGLRGCARCLDACPAGAIRSTGDYVQVDAVLCQGCASCTLACPTGALTFNRPQRGALRRSLRGILDGIIEECGTAPVIVAHAPGMQAAIDAARLPDRARTFQVDALPAFGEELWFEVLAAGASGVVIANGPGAPVEEQRLLDTKIAEARTLLAGKGISAGRIALAELGALTAAVEAIPAHSTGAIPYTVNEAMRKRPAILAALDALHAEPDVAGAPVQVPAGLPFGEVVVDRGKCTLCFACVNLCPTAALLAEPEPEPKLRFSEAGCVQCGLCETGCPEKAITLGARIVQGLSLRAEARLLHEDVMFRCIECGTPFISRRLLESSLERMKDHPVLEDQGIERLKTCPACRQRATMMN
ncbi:MAG: 4Fe-4S binding protein [Betaproteobacteria bacterium]|nr:4Fe-4S binding protein [Betaproteobacteria bacterium]